MLLNLEMFEWLLNITNAGVNWQTVVYTNNTG